MPETATIKSLPAAFRMMKAMRAGDVEWGEDYRGATRQALGRLLEACSRAAEERLRRLRAEVDDDPGAASRRQAAARQRAALDRQRRVAEALATTLQLQAARQARAQRDGRGRRGQAEGVAPAGGSPPQARASTTDPQARVTKMADGGDRPAYNAQLATDTHSGPIAGVALDNLASDMGKLQPMSD